MDGGPQQTQLDFGRRTIGMNRHARMGAEGQGFLAAPIRMKAQPPGSGINRPQNQRPSLRCAVRPNRCQNGRVEGRATVLHATGHPPPSLGQAGCQIIITGERYLHGQAYVWQRGWDQLQRPWQRWPRTCMICVIDPAGRDNKRDIKSTRKRDEDP